MAPKVVVYLAPEDKQALERCAKADGLKLSAFLRLLLKRFLAQQGPVQLNGAPKSSREEV